MNEVKAPIRTGVIGVGRIGAHHARVAGLSPQAHLVGVAERDGARRRWAEEQLRVPAVADFHALLPEVDAVVVAVPTALHAAVAQDCLEAGKHTLVEKPFATRAEEGLGLVQLAERAGVVLQVGYVEHFNPAVAALARAIEGQAVRTIEAQRLSPYEPRAWDTDVVLDLMVHDLSLLLALVPDEIAEVQAMGGVGESGHVDFAFAQLRFSGGAFARLSASRVTPQKVREICVTTSAAFVRLDGVERKITASQHTVASREDLGYRQRTLLETIWVPYVEPLAAQFEHFVGCIREGVPPRIDGRHGVQVLRLADRVRDALLDENGQRDQRAANQSNR